MQRGEGRSGGPSSGRGACSGPGGPRRPLAPGPLHMRTPDPPFASDLAARDWRGRGSGAQHAGANASAGEGAAPPPGPPQRGLVHYCRRTMPRRRALPALAPPAVAAAARRRLRSWPTRCACCCPRRACPTPSTAWATCWRSSAAFLASTSSPRMSPRRRRWARVRGCGRVGGRRARHHTRCCAARPPAVWHSGATAEVAAAACWLLSCGAGASGLCWLCSCRRSCPPPTAPAPQSAACSRAASRR